MRVAIYVRVSTDEQARHGYSLDHQESECRRVSTARDWEISGVFRDEGYSGGSLDRPGLKSLLHEVELRRVDVILVWKTDRLSRWLPHIVDLVLAKFPAHGVAFSSATEPYETTTPAGRMFFSQLAAFADFERSMIMERTATGRRAAALAGRWATGSAPYGYKLVGEKGRRRLTVVEDEAAVVKRVFAQRLAGASLRSIARALNRSAIQAPRGGAWSPQTLGRILGNPVYTGQAVWGRYRGAGRGRRAMPQDEWLVVPGARHDPVVSVEAWERVRGMRGERPRGIGPRTEGGFYLSGLLRCGLCGAPMVSLTNGSWRGYRCRKRLEGGVEACSLPYLGQEKIEKVVAAALLERLDSLRKEGVSLEGSSEESRQVMGDLEADLAALRRRQSECRRAEERWLRLFERGEVRAEWDAVEQRLAELSREGVYLERLREAKALELETARGRLERLKQRGDALFESTGVGPCDTDLWKGLSAKEKAAVARLLLKEVRIGPGLRLEILFWSRPGASRAAGDAGDLP